MVKEKLEVDLDKLADLSGESSIKRVKYIVPVLKFDGRNGNWNLLTPDSSGQFVAEPVKKNIEGVILKVRRAFSAFEKIPEGGSIRYFTNEHNSRTDKLVLFERRSSSNRSKMIDEGLIDDLRKRHPSLRMRQNLYFLFQNEIVKLGVRGKSLASLFSYYKEFEVDEHIFQFVTRIENHEETNEAGMTYFVMDFFKDRKSDLVEVSTRIQEVAERLRLQDKSYGEISGPEEETGLEETEQPGESAEEPKELPKEEETVGNTEEETENHEIEVKDIPL